MNITTRKPPIRLYDKPECPFCWKVRLALTEAGLDYEETAFTGPERPAEFLAINPKGTVPVLVDEGNIIIDSSIALEYVEDLMGRPVLLPEETTLRLQARTLHHYANTVIGPSLREVVFEKRGKPEREWDWKRIREGAAGWRECLVQLSAWLNGKEFFAGRFSFAECALIPRFGLAEAYGVGVTDEFPTLRDWYARMKRRPSFATTAPPRVLALPSDGGQSQTSMAETA